MVGTALQDVRKATRKTLWNKPVIPDHFSVKFMIRDESLKQEQMSSQSTLLRALKVRMSSYLGALSELFPQLKHAQDNYLLQEQSIFAKDTKSDITITLCITSRSLISEMRTLYLSNSSSRAPTGAWAQNTLTSRVPIIKINESITLTNASFPSTPRTLATTNQDMAASHTIRSL
jgi:hypothetical protein